MDYKLIKIKEGCVILFNEITGFENNIWVYNNGRIWVWKSTMALRSNNKPKKIIASTFIPELPNIDFNGLEEEFGIVDIEKLTFDIYPEIIKERWYEEGLAYEEDIHEGNREGFVEGFNKCLSLNKDKLYTKEDLKFHLQSFGLVLFGQILRKEVDITEEVKSSAITYFKSLQPKTEWDIQFIDGKVYPI
jgi:hypothetical protein